MCVDAQADLNLHTSYWLEDTFLLHAVHIKMYKVKAKS